MHLFSGNAHHEIGLGHHELMLESQVFFVSFLGGTETRGRFISDLGQK